MEANWTKIYATSDFYRAEMIRQILIEHDIPAVILNKQDSSYRFGSVEIWTHRDDKIAAIVVIEEMESDTNPNS